MHTIKFYRLSQYWWFSSGIMYKECHGNPIAWYLLLKLLYELNQRTSLWIILLLLHLVDFLIHVLYMHYELTNSPYTPHFIVFDPSNTLTIHPRESTPCPQNVYLGSYCYFHIGFNSCLYTYMKNHVLMQYFDFILVYIYYVVYWKRNEYLNLKKWNEAHHRLEKIITEMQTEALD